MSEIDLEALAAKVEALDGPCRETDALIADAVLGPVKPPYRRGHCEKYTASMDSAMSLVGGEDDPLDILEAAIQSAREDRDGVYFLPLHIVASAIRARAALSRLSPPNEVKHG